MQPKRRNLQGVLLELLAEELTGLPGECTKRDIAQSLD